MDPPVIVCINHREIVESLVKENINLFTEKYTDLGKSNMIKVSIDSGSHPPIKLRPYRTPFAKCQIVDKAVDAMLAANVICPSRSP